MKERKKERNFINENIANICFTLPKIASQKMPPNFTKRVYMNPLKIKPLQIPFKPPTLENTLLPNYRNMETVRSVHPDDRAKKRGSGG